MGRSSWTDLHGPIFMDRISWTEFHGPNFMDRISWNEFHGPNFMDRISWTEFHGRSIGGCRRAARPRRYSAAGRPSVGAVLPVGSTNPAVDKTLRRKFP